MGFPVRPTGDRPQVGDDAPALPSPTLDDAPIEQLTAAPDPLALLYRRSVAELLAAKRPFLLLFATPQRCGRAADLPPGAGAGGADRARGGA